VYCAFRPGAGWEAIWRQQQPQASVADRAAFDHTLAAIRARGMERSIDTPIPAVSSLSVPVLDAGGTLRLVLTVVGSTGAIDADWNGPVATALQATARAIGANLGQA
jgi:DNA-binding IclR family transcriptional regulator